MTPSTTIQQVKLVDIDLGDRAREDLGDLDSLATSMRLYGLISPIIVRKEDMRLVIGGRRLEAARVLGWETIEVIFKEDCSDVLLKEIELEENLQRLKLSWQEEVRAKRDLHELKQKQFGEAARFHEGGWRLEDTAKGLNISIGSLSMDIQLARGMDVYPELKGEKDKTTAYRQLKKMEKDEERKQTPDKILIYSELPIVTGDGYEWLRKFKEGTIDLILTEPPEMNDVFLSYAHRALKDNGSILLFLPPSEHTRLEEMCGREEFGLAPNPFTWVHSSNARAGSGKHYPKGYETIFYLYKEPRDLQGRASSDWFEVKQVDPRDKYHPDQKPLALLRLLIAYHTEVGELVIDPFAGSGSTVIAALQMKRIGMGCEIREEYAQSANEALKDAMIKLDQDKEYESLEERPGVTHHKPEKKKKLDPKRDFFEI